VKYVEKPPEEVVDDNKEFVRTPLRSKEENFEYKPVD
jgi:hypothetical protein